MRNQISHSGTDPRATWHAISEVGDTIAISIHSLNAGAGVFRRVAGKNVSNGGVLDIPSRHLINHSGHPDRSFRKTGSGQVPTRGFEKSAWFTPLEFVRRLVGFV
jgi:hypothetical protein